MLTFVIVWFVSFLVYCALYAYLMARYERNETLTVVGMGALCIAVMTIGFGSGIIMNDVPSWWYLDYGTVGKIAKLQIAVTVFLGVMATIIFVVCGLVALVCGMQELAGWVGKREKKNHD